MRPAGAHPSPAIGVSTEEWPIVRMTFEGAVTPELMRDIILQLVDLSTRADEEGVGLRMLAVLDSLNPHNVTAAMRKEHAELLGRYLPRLSRSTSAEARVVTQPILRGVLTAMTWLLPHPWPVEVFSNEADARTWLNQQCNPSAAHG